MNLKIVFESKQSRLDDVSFDKVAQIELELKNNLKRCFCLSLCLEYFLFLIFRIVGA